MGLKTIDLAPKWRKISPKMQKARPILPLFALMICLTVMIVPWSSQLSGSLWNRVELWYTFSSRLKKKTGTTESMHPEEGWKNVMRASEKNRSEGGLLRRTKESVISQKIVIDMITIIEIIKKRTM